jgi:hypothetical protein
MAGNPLAERLFTELAAAALAARKVSAAKQ